MPSVSIVKAKPESILNDYSRLLDLANYKKHLPNSEDALLKLNLSWSLYFPACSTEPWQLEGVLRKLKRGGHKKLYPVENRTVVTDVWKGAKQNKWLPVLEKYKLKYMPLTEVKWIKYEPGAEMLALDKIFPDGLKIPKMFIGKNICHLPTLKTHGHTRMTGAMKNAFGGLITERRHHCHKCIHKVLVDLLTIQKEIHPRMFAVMDGTVAGDGAGPRTMKPVSANLILASDDQVAIDAVAAKLMGYDPMKINFIRLAHEKGLGCGDIEQIDLIGDDVSKINLKFTTHKSPVIFFDQLFRKKLSFIEPLLFHTGLFNLCIFGSAFYHDYLWYPLVGKRRIKKFKKTQWGRLFEKY